MKTQASPHVVEIMTKLRKLLAEHNRRANVPLVLADDGFVEQDEWVHLIVTPQKQGLRAYDYVDQLTELERRLREQVGENVLIVPAMPD